VSRAPARVRRDPRTAASRRRRGAPRRGPEIVGRDLVRARLSRARRRRLLVPAVVGLVAAALALAALRVDVLRVRYALARAVAEEAELREERRAWTARVRALRDPGRLLARAKALDLGPPERTLRLPRAAAAAERSEP